MKLTIAIFGMLGLLWSPASFAAKPKSKPVAKRVVTKAQIKKTARPAKIPAKVVSKSPVKQRVVTANRKPAQAAPEVIPPKLSKAESAAASKPSFNDTARLASSIRSMTTTPSAPTTGGGGMMRGPGSSHEIGEAMRVTGQSRNLSMGLLFSKDGDKIEFGNPRMHYKDKISSKEANY